MDVKTFKKELKQKMAAMASAHELTEAMRKDIEAIHRFIDESNPVSAASVSVEVCATEVKGILYYIDAFQNVYRTEDILESRENPRIIGKAEI
jgi:hypothetical protein